MSTSLKSIGRIGINHSAWKLFQIFTNREQKENFLKITRACIFLQFIGLSLFIFSASTKILKLSFTTAFAVGLILTDYGILKTSVISPS